MHSVCYTQERDKNFEDEFLRNRWTFFNRRVSHVHNFWFPATFITDKFWSDPRLWRSHRGDVFCILFHRSIDRAILLVTLFHRSIDRAILLVTLFDISQFGDTLCVFHFQKKNNDQKKNGLLIWWHYFWWHFFLFSFPKNQFRNIPTRNHATCASGSGSVGVTPAHFPPPLQLLLFGDTFCHTFDRERQLR